MTLVQRIKQAFGPRVPSDELQRHPGRYVLPHLFLLAAAVLLIVSIFLPYWEMTLQAPQYPEGLQVRAYLNELGPEQQVQEINGLNHYIGMAKLDKAAQLEREVSIVLIVVLAALLAAGVFIHNWWAALLALPAVVFPIFFLADLQFWLYYYGHNLDPSAPLSGAIEPFTPPVLGPGKIGQFKTIAYPGAGLILATVSAGLVLIGLWLHRRAYKPLVDARRHNAEATQEIEAHHETG
jgi:hypothetical protein